MECLMAVDTQTREKATDTLVHLPREARLPKTYSTRYVTVNIVKSTSDIVIVGNSTILANLNNG